MLTKKRVVSSAFLFLKNRVLPFSDFEIYRFSPLNFRKAIPALHVWLQLPVK